MSEETNANREYRDRLFKFIFGNPENKEWTLSLYNAINDSDYTNADEIVFNIIENVLYMSMKNDVSFFIDNTMNLYEQQSTYNPNMPMRFLIYAGMAYSRFVQSSDDEYSLYSSGLQDVPVPQCVCFYNGTVDKDDSLTLRFTDACRKSHRRSAIEVEVLMININYGHNKALLDACKPLKEYSWFVDRVRSHQQKGESLDQALDAALAELPDDSLIKPFLLGNKAEVKRMCITEYNETRTFALQKAEGIKIGRAEGIKIGRAEGRAEGREEGRAEGREEGRAEGREEGGLRMLISLVKEGLLSVSDAAKKVNMTVSEFERKLV